MIPRPLQQNQIPIIGRTTKIIIITIVLRLVWSTGRIYVTGDEEVEGAGGRVSCGVGVLEPLSVVVILVVEAVVAGAGRAETIEHQHHKSNIANTFRKMCRTMTTRLPSNFWQVTTSAGNHYIHTFWEAQVRLRVGNE